MEKIKTNKIGIFSDIHWGKSRDNIGKIKLAEEAVELFIDEMLKENIKTVFFLGDWFDHRNSVNVNTGFRAYAMIKKLCRNFKVFMIVGNHDTYYKNSTEVNSLQQYENIKNLHIISEDTEFDICGKKLLATPWGFDIDDYKDKEYDFLFGHFEPGGAILNQSGMYSRSEAYTMSDLTDIAPVVMSGHYHTRRHYQTKSGGFFSVGSPLELTWSDYENEKGFYILDVNEEFGIKFIKNEVSPIHYKYFWSQLKRKTQVLDADNITNNYIKVIVDDKYKYEDIMRIMDVIQSLNPISAEPDFIFSINKDLLEDIDMSSNTKLKYTKLEYIIKYISKINKKEINIEGIDKDVLIEKAIKYYNQTEQ
jgi:DNA repair exonuclease SbcCD nuclease subunit